MKQRLKRNLVVLTVLVFVGAAVYLNWRYAGELPGEDGGENVDKVLGESTLVNGEGDEGDTPAVQTDYFSAARLTRQQARDSAISLLQEAAAQENADAAVANEASQGIQVLASYTLKEAQIENLVTAKGYSDCVAFMGDESVSVVVSTPSGELTAEDVAKITDITMSETGFSASGIKIMPAN